MELFEFSIIGPNRSQISNADSITREMKGKALSFTFGISDLEGHEGLAALSSPER